MSTITQLMTGTYTVEEYERMIDDGKIGEEDQVELIEGRIVAKMPKKPPHRVATTKTFEALGRVVPAAWHVSKEDAIVVGPRSKPEPNVAVVRAAFKYDASRDPTAADCCLVVEVAERSLRKDRGEKLRDYARGGIPVYWIVNVKDKQIELYTEPVPAGRYKSRVDYRPGDVVPVVIDGSRRAGIGQIAVVDLLP